MNDAGQVAFNALLRGEGINTTNGRALYGYDNPNVTVEVARRGQSAPTGPGSFVDFSEPLINQSGQVAYRATLGNAGSNASNDEGIYLFDGVETVQIVRRGQDHPTGLGKFSFLHREFTVNDIGQVTFNGRITEGSGADSTTFYGLYRSDGSDLVEIVRIGQAAPTGPGSFASIVSPFHAMNNRGQVAFMASFSGEGVNHNNNFGVFLYDDILG